MNYWENYYSIHLISSRTRRADFVCKQKHLSSVSAFFRQFKSADLPFQNQDNFGVGFVDLVQSHHIWVGLGQLQHCYLVEDVHAAVCSLSSLSQKLGSILLSRCLLSAFLHHSKFSPGNQKRGDMKGVISEETDKWQWVIVSDEAGYEFMHDKRNFYGLTQR